ncbi:MAG TPA: condensation domain-containing protein, partial [Thermoanaerobaculia bacterium]|nr:condensation domain-containing protein [Thermoanaerobaculia bacterium]
AAFVSLAAIPLSPNGKVDRRALSKLDVSVSSSREYVGPRSETEQRLVAIWAEVLGRAPETIGVYDNFFELGGHSLLATQVISKIRVQLETELPLKALFERPTVAELAELQGTAEKSTVPAIRSIDRARYERLPLSFAQERLWFLAQLEPDSAGYNIPGAVTVRGELDAAQLEQAINMVIARHENLRTVFPSENGQARQRILDRLDFRLERIDLSRDTDAESRRHEARRICTADAATGFDLAAGPLIRGKVIRLAEDEHVLMFNMHHIVNDGWSTGILLREVGAILDAWRNGREPELAPLPIQYADYSVWQREWLEQGGALDRQLGYWQQKLAGTPESLDLPVDYPRPGVQTFGGAAQPFLLDAELTAQLARLAEQHGATLFMVLLAAVKTLLHRYTGAEDICVGSPIANRQYAETEGLIGMFVNTLALRSRIDGEESFATLLPKVKATCLEAYEHQDAPFEKIVDALHLQRNLAVSPLFQVMVILQNTERGADDSSIERFPLESRVSKFDLTFELTERPEGLAGTISYRTALYKRQTIERMVEHLTALCRAIVAAPRARIAELDYVGERESRRLLVEYNATRADYPQGQCLHELFTKQVATYADQPAVHCGDEQLTYRQLYERSSDLALYLQSQGVQPDRLVGVCMERSLDMVVGMLAILQAGGAYVPLDPNYPGERLA